jgi:palmitoyl-protein thioesterase
MKATPELRAMNSELASLVDRAATEPAALAAALKAYSVKTIAPVMESLPRGDPLKANADVLPVVVTHGMGDSCFNAGMKSITTFAGEQVGAYSTCIPTGDNEISDTINGFLLNMDKSVDVFAKKVRADPKLANGFNAFSLSQGSQLIRGYIIKYNDPPVHTFMSICGVNAGVGTFPQCSPDTPIIGGICKSLDGILGLAAYTSIMQDTLFQANYYRDPGLTNSSAYLDHSQLADWGNEKTINATYKANFAKSSKFVWVEGTEDTVVWPREGEWWGAPDPSDPWKKVDPMNETLWYTKDTFGLKTADEAGKNNFESFPGEHIRMTNAELKEWLQKYFM